MKKNDKRSFRLIMGGTFPFLVKFSRFLLLALPVIFAVLALSGRGSFYRSAVPASCCIILLAVSDQKIKSMIWLIVVAFLFSIVGDWFMSHRNGQLLRFIWGIGCFLMAHIGYILFCVQQGKIRYKLLSFLLIGYLLLFYVVLYPSIHDNGLLAAVLLYILVSCLSLAAAAGLRLPPATRRLFAIGIALLVFSDTLIAFREFAGYKAVYYLMFPTYYGSQIMITLSLLLLSLNRKTS